MLRSGDPVQSENIAACGADGVFDDREVGRVIGVGGEVGLRRIPAVDDVAEWLCGGGSMAQNGFYGKMGDVWEGTEGAEVGNHGVDLGCGGGWFGG